MRALVYGVKPERWDPPDPGNRLLVGLSRVPMRLVERERPAPVRPDWVVLKTRLTGICGSDAKQVFMDFGDDYTDSALAPYFSAPTVLGHEVVADVAELGPQARGLEVGQRVVLNPWLTCRPRGIEPPCPSCQDGDLSMCWHFTEGALAPGIHTGTSRDAPGGFADYLPAHDSMCIPVPDALPDEVAALAERLGATVMAPDPLPQLIEDAAAWSGGVLQRGGPGLPMAHPGGVDVVYDTIGTAETSEVSVRLLKTRGALVKSGVHAPARWEWSPLYFKEISWVGSNAFGIEEVDGVRKHGIAHYLDMAAAGRVDVRAMLTHRFALADWRQAFTALARQADSGAVKAVFDFR